MSGNDNGRPQDLLAVARGVIPEPSVQLRVQPGRGACFVHVQITGTTRVNIGDRVSLATASEMVRRAYAELAADLRLRLRRHLAAMSTNVRQL